jgi:hypothetical protein
MGTKIKKEEGGVKKLETKKAEHRGFGLLNSYFLMLTFTAARRSSW